MQTKKNTFRKKRRFSCKKCLSKYKNNQNKNGGNCNYNTNNIMPSCCKEELLKIKNIKKNNILFN